MSFNSLIFNFPNLLSKKIYLYLTNKDIKGILKEVKKDSLIIKDGTEDIKIPYINIEAFSFEHKYPYLKTNKKYKKLSEERFFYLKKYFLSFDSPILNFKVETISGRIFIGFAHKNYIKKWKETIKLRYNKINVFILTNKVANIKVIEI